MYYHVFHYISCYITEIWITFRTVHSTAIYLPALYVAIPQIAYVRVYIAYVQRYTSTAISLVNAVVTVAAGLSNGNARSSTSFFLLDKSQKQLFLAYPMGMLEVSLLPSYWTGASNSCCGLSNGNVWSSPSSFLLDRSQQRLFLVYPMGMLEVPLLPSFLDRSQQQLFLVYPMGMSEAPLHPSYWTGLRSQQQLFLAYPMGMSEPPLHLVFGLFWRNARSPHSSFLLDKSQQN